MFLLTSTTPMRIMLFMDGGHEPLNIKLKKQSSTSKGNIMENTSNTTAHTLDVSFFFRDPTQKMKDANKEEGLPEPIKRKAVVIAVPSLTKDEVLEILMSDDTINSKAQELIVEQVNAVLAAEVRSQIDDLPTYEEVDVTKIDFTKVNFVALANTPRATRSGGGISEESWDDFGTDFVTVIVPVKGITDEQAKKVVTLLTKRLKDVSKQEVVLDKLSEYLDTWFASTSAASQVSLAQVYERLSKRIEGYKSAVNDDPLASLGI